MDGNGKLSVDELKNMEAGHSNGQPGVDIIIIEPERDESKVRGETNVGEGPFEDNREHKCEETDNGVHEEASTSTDDDSDSDFYFLRESENGRTSESDAEENGIEVPLPEEEVEELVAEFLDVESKAAKAQESLEKESLEKIEAEVRLELSERLQGDVLELAVSTEMEQFKNEWSTELDDLEIHSAVLLEQLDAAGIELPSLYKSIESQVPNVCETEAWKNRTHWVGSQVPEEANQSIRKADEYLQSCRPVRRKHGKLLEEGAGGFLAGKVPIGDDGSVQCHEKSWSSFNELIKSKECAESSFGSDNWASVYLASTPQEAAALGLQFPGVDEVEEIAEVEGDVDVIKGFDEIELSEEQRRKYKKVREEDDAKTIRRLRRQMKKRTRSCCKENFGLASSSNGFSELPPLSDNGVLGSSSGLLSSEKHKSDKNEISGEPLKRTREDDFELDHKRPKTVIVESDDDMLINSKPALGNQGSDSSSAEVKKVVDIIDLDLLPSESPNFGDKALPKVFKCTVCTEMLNARDVHRHPVLDVTICGSCRFLVIEKNRLEGPVSGGYCTWCVQCEQLQSCSSCRMLFCTNCLSKNFGEECLSKAKVAGWQCCCCQPRQLEHLISECDKALSGVESSDLESDNTSGNESDGPVSKHKRKKRIRRIIDDTELGEETKRKIAMEKARQEHLKSMHEQSASKLSRSNIVTFSGVLSEVSLQDAGDGHIVNVAREEDEEPVRIPSSVSSKLKPHQVSGIRFMWENVIQSVRTVKSGDKGFGCILAHNMGLGKTFQVITFLYVVMRCVQLGFRTALIVTPVNVLHNWRKEFTKWRPDELKTLHVFMLEDVARVKRLQLLNKWRAKGGVLLIGYSSFRNLSLGRHAREKYTADEISNALQCGPDILVCDEAHMIKNRRADITHALKQVRTQRRIALTGSPLQNNLMEYYCMVDFVREGFLGSSHEFRNRFQNPIENGQHTNSTSDDVKIMNQRSHILYEQLKGFVQRMDMNVVKNDLPPKKVFVITVKLSQLQRKLYRRFLDVHGFSSGGASEKPLQRSGFFAKYQKLAQIWNHPGLLQMAKEQRGIVRREDAVENFLTDESSSDDNPNIENQLPDREKQKSKTDQQSKKSDFVNEESNWWENLLDANTYMEADYSGKMVLLLDILSTCYELGEKVLVFSQNLTTLDLVEFYLSKLQIKGKERKFWKQGKDWYRLDGSTPSSERQNLVERFNEPANTRVKCTLISTRAGSLGINLHAANRVVLLDGSWNPTHDLQAIYRVWRYGQTKPVYAYRLMAYGTMEEKIYKRQVTKEGLAARVVDRQQVSRTISREEMLHLFEFGDEESLDQCCNGSTIIDHTAVGTEKLSTSSSKTTELPVDKLMLNLLSDHSRWIAGYHEHEALLQENEDERLTKEEQDMAWSSFKKAQQLEAVPRRSHDPERKPNVIALPTQTSLVPPKVTSRSRQPQQPKTNSNQKKCTNLTHLLTLRSHGTKAGCTTSCTECGQDISWETLNRDGGRLR